MKNIIFWNGFGLCCKINPNEINFVNVKVKKTRGLETVPIIDCKWAKDTNIERLKKMCWMQKRFGKNNFLINTELNHLNRYVQVVTINKKCLYSSWWYFLDFVSNSTIYLYPISLLVYPELLYLMVPINFPSGSWGKVSCQTFICNLVLKIINSDRASPVPKIYFSIEDSSQFLEWIRLVKMSVFL